MLFLLVLCVDVFFFKQKTAYEMRSSDWSSDVCSSDLVKSPAAHGVRSVITARSHLVEARVRLDNTIRGLCATFGYRPGAGQGKAFLERIMQAAHTPGLGDAIDSLLSVRAELVEQIERRNGVWGKRGSISVDLGGG